MRFVVVIIIIIIEYSGGSTKKKYAAIDEDDSHCFETSFSTIKGKRSFHFDKSEQNLASSKSCSNIHFLKAEIPLSFKCASYPWRT